MISNLNQAGTPRGHPRTVGWFGTTAVAMGGINQSLFLLSALFIGQGSIPGQGSAAVVLLGVGLLLSWAATPGWTELILMYPNRVGGIAATCAEAFRPYSPILANLTGVCYWWGWVPTCGLTALLASSAINHWYLPWIPVPLMASCIVLFFTAINLCGVKWVMRFAMPIAIASAGLAFISATMPIFSGSVDWHQAFTFHLTVPFPGWFGQVTSVMAGLYLIGFAAPAFEQAACHVGETIDPNKNVPRAMFASAGLATLYFVVLPIVWLGALGPEAMGKELAVVLGPTFAPLLGGAAKATAIWFMVFNMLHGTIAALAGASRTLAQLSEDGLLPEFLAKRSRTDAPWAATLLTSGMAIAFLLIGDPIWLIAAANLTYLIGIALPSVAVWLLRHNEPEMARPYRAPRGTIMFGLLAAGAWALTAILGFQQFGLPTVLIGIGFAYSGSVLYAWRKFADRRKAGLRGIARTLHLKLTGAMLIVLLLDAFGYLIAVGHVPEHHQLLIVVLEDTFVVVAMLTFVVGLILPGMIAHSAVEVAKAADKLVRGTLADFTRAMEALAAGDLDAAKAHFDFAPVVVHSRDEVGDMALSFNKLQEEIGRAAVGLEGARKGLSEARDRLEMRTSELNRSNSALTTTHVEMKASEHRLRMILETQAECVKLVAADGSLLEMNRAGLAFIEADTLEQVLGRSVYDLVAPEQQAMFRALNEATFRGESKTAEFEIIGLKGTRRWMQTHACPLRDMDGKIVAQLAVASDITGRKLAEAALENAHRELLETSRQAGMAEVATSVLHNVGNVLNSVNVSCAVVAERVRKSRVGSVGKTAALLHQHTDDLSTYFTVDPTGRKLPAYLGKLAQQLSDERAEVLRELQLLARNIDHIKEIVARQQNYAKVSGITETLLMADLVEDSLKMNEGFLANHGLRVIRDYSEVPGIIVEKHKVLQILVNLIRNAKDACHDSGIEDKQITLRVSMGPDCVRVSVIDTGVGIPPENLTRIFAHGFTTKVDGHGFGLHSGALAAREMGGRLTVHSDGHRTGATFTLELPATPSAQLTLQP